MNKYTFDLQNELHNCLGTFIIECESFPTSEYIANYLVNNKEKFFKQELLNDTRTTLMAMSDPYVKNSGYITSIWNIDTICPTNKFYISNIKNI